MQLDSTQNGLQQALDRFSDACSVAGMKISSTKTETMCLSRQPKQCSLQIDGVPLKQSEKFKYLGVSFTSDGRQNSELDIRIGKASAVMRQLHRSVVLKRELCTKAKLSIFRSVYVPILTYGHECWFMNEKVRSRIQAAEMGFLRRPRPAVSSVAKRTLSVREVWGSIPWPVKSAQCRQRLATAATFLRSCAAEALSRGDGPRNSLHAST